MSSFLHTAGGLCSQKPVIYLETLHSDPCYFLPVALRLCAPRRASFVTRNAIWLRRRTLHQRGRRGREGAVTGVGGGVSVCRYSSYLLTLSVKSPGGYHNWSPLARGGPFACCFRTSIHGNLFFDQQVSLTEHFHANRANAHVAGLNRHLPVVAAA